MELLLERIRKDAEYLGEGIIKLDSFLNHQVDAGLTYKMAEEFLRLFEKHGVTGTNKVVTAEVSGIPSALMVSLILDVPLLFARKHQSATMTDIYYMAQARSRTRGNDVNLMVAKKYLGSDDKVLLIDDFLATGSTLNALCSLITESGAELQGIGCVIEKPQEGGRDILAPLNVPIESLAKLSWEGETLQLNS